MSCCWSFSAGLAARLDRRQPIAKEADSRLALKRDHVRRAAHLVGDAVAVKALHLDEDILVRQVEVERKPCGDSPTLAEISDDDYFWSAVGMSYFFREAGFKEDQFPFSNSHSTWIRAFIRARRKEEQALYYGYRLNSPRAKPDVGDLVGYGRGGLTFKEAQQLYDRTGRYASHTDLVVEKRDREMDVIGANVMDSVAKKTVALDADGLISDRTFNWFVVMKLQL